MTSIDDIASIDLQAHADTFLRLIGDHGRLHTSQLHEYVSLRLRLHLHDSHKTELTDYLIGKGGKRDKTTPDIIQMPVKRRLGLPGRKRDKATIDMFGGGEKKGDGILTVPAPKKTVERKPRYYQTACIEAINASLVDNRSTLAVLATGLGKSFIFAKAAQGWKGRVLFLAHREELVFQNKETVEQTCGEYCGVEKAEYTCGNERLVSASVQSMVARLKKFSPDHFAYIVVDEAHRATNPTYLDIFAYFAKAKILGVTATPDRHDEKALGKVFDDVCFVMDIEDGIEAGYLVPVEGRTVFVEEVDLSNVSTVAGDLNQGELDEEMCKATEAVATEMYRAAGNEQAIIFTPGVKSAHAMCARMNEIAPDKAIAIDGKTDPWDRKSLIEGFKSRKYQFLFNCQVAVEGFDAPETSIVGQARPTSSRAFYSQGCGRGTRVLPGVVDSIEGEERAGERRAAIAASRKPRMTILDFVGNAGRHSLVGPVDVLGGNYSEEEVALAKKKVKAEGGGDVPKALKDARAELKALAKRMAEAKAKVKSQVTPFDPFACLGINREQGISIRFGAKPIMDWQVEKLTRLGLPGDVVRQMDFRTAKKAADNIHRRIDLGLASLKQLNLLSDFTPVSDTVTLAAASKAIDYIFRMKKRPNPAVLKSILDGK